MSMYGETDAEFADKANHGLEIQTCDYQRREYHCGGHGAYYPGIL